MSSLRDMIDGKTLDAATDDSAKGQLFDHVKNAAHTKADYDVAKMKLATKLAPMQSLINLTQQMHGPNPQDPNDPFQNPYMQQGEGGPGGTGQGMNNQDNLARTGQMVKPQLGQDPNNYLAKQSKGIPGQPNGDGNKKLQTPGAQLNQGKAPQRSTSGQKPPGKVSQATDGKPAKKGKKIKLEISDDKMAAGGIKNGMKRCKTCKNFFNPTHPKAGKSHCPTCKQGSIAAARSAGHKTKSFRRLTVGLDDAERFLKGDRKGFKVHAGGPGSGRRQSEQTMAEETANNYRFDKAGEDAVNRDYGWGKNKPQQKLKFYKGPMTARKDFPVTTKRGKKVSTTGDYHNDAGKSMPTVGVGLSAGHAMRKKWVAAKTGKPSIGPFPSSLVGKK